MSNWPKPQEIVDGALRAEVQKLLAQCTEDQQKFFKRLYPEGLEKMPEHKLRNAIPQCQRTIDKNRRALQEQSNG